MATIYNEIEIDAPVERIWEALSNIEVLDQYDPTVKKSLAISSAKSGIGSIRKVDMKDGKNWFKEKCTVWEPNKALTFELTACSFPVHKLQHTYNFRKNGNKIKVSQVMTYRMKYGLFGKMLDALMMKKKSDEGIKQFLGGLKSYTEK